MVPISAALGGLLNNLAKLAVGRPRPPTAVFTHARGFGFPSGHTVGFTSFAVAVAGLVVVLGASRLKRIIVSTIAAVASVAVGLSRVVVGAHWLTDVIGGLVLGAAIGLAVIATAMRLRSPPQGGRRIGLRADDRTGRGS
jgi:undecaprenyl-diphosphatase